MRLYEIRLGRPYNSAARRENRRGIADKRWWKRRGGASQQVWVLASLRLHCSLPRFCPRSYEIQNCDRLTLPSKCSIYVDYLRFLSNPTSNCPPPTHRPTIIRCSIPLVFMKQIKKLIVIIYKLTCIGIFKPVCPCGFPQIQ